MALSADVEEIRLVPEGAETKTGPALAESRERLGPKRGGTLLARMQLHDSDKFADRDIRLEYVEQLTDAEKQMLREEFAVYDKDKSGYISMSELGTVLRSLGEDPSDDDLRKMIAEVDADNDEKISFQEFIIMMAKKMCVARWRARWRGSARCPPSPHATSGRSAR